MTARCALPLAARQARRRSAHPGRRRKHLRLGVHPALFPLFLTVLALTTGVGWPSSAAPYACTVQELQDDLRQMRSLLETRHPALYAFTDRATFEDLYAHAQAQLDRPMTARELFPVVAPIVARVGCGHTHLTMTADSLAAYPDRFLPVRLYLRGNRAFVRDLIPPASGLRRTKIRGAELLAVNGVPVPDILDRMRSVISSDGGREAWKTALLNGSMLYDLYALLFGFPETFALTLAATPEESVTLRLPAVPRSAATERPARAGARRTMTTGDPALDFTLLPEDGAALLTIGSFAHYQTREKFFAIIDGVFERLHATGCRNLILDLRGNSGGDPYCAAHLLAYLAPAPRPYFARGYPDYAPLADPLPVPENRFRGELFTLIDGGCFSTTGHFCALLRHHRIGVFIGSETGATYTCNDASRTETLRASGLRLRVAHRNYAVAVTGMSEETGITPEVPVEPSIRDLLSGRDPVLEQARDLIERRREARPESGGALPRPGEIR